MGSRPLARVHTLALGSSSSSGWVRQREVSPSPPVTERVLLSTDPSWGSWGAPQLPFARFHLLTRHRHLQPAPGLCSQQDCSLNQRQFGRTSGGTATPRRAAVTAAAGAEPPRSPAARAWASELFNKE